nr:VQ motif-containing protein 20-like [Ipomoea batatas]
MSPPHFQGYNQQIIMSRRINNPALKINPGSRFIKKSSPPPPSPPLQPSPPLDGPMATSGGPRHPVVIYTHSPKIIRTHPKDFMALVQKLTGYSAPASAPPSPPSPPPPLPEPCDEYLITDISNNSDHSGGNNTNKSSSDDDVIGARFNWLMMGEDKDLTTMDEKVTKFRSSVMGEETKVAVMGEETKVALGNLVIVFGSPSWLEKVTTQWSSPGRLLGVVVSGSPSWLVAFCWGRLGKAVVEFYIQRSWSPPYHFVWSPPYHFVALKFAEISSLG